MVVGYECVDCGFQHNCDMSENGERLCPTCGTEVTGITTQDASPPDPETQNFVVTISRVGSRKRKITVSAHSYESAWDSANVKTNADEYVTDITTERWAR